MRARSAVVRSGPNGLSLSVPRATGGGGGQRDRVRGWSRKACARHVRWLQSVEAGRLTGFGYAVTLTLRDIPSSTQWGQLRSQWLRKIRETGALRDHWVVEWQERGAPHLHVAVYYETELTALQQYQIVDWWVTIAESFGAQMWGQDIKPIQGDGIGWAKYQAKHSARSLAHYQRSTMPPGWESTGRLWGQRGDWPVREDKYIVSGPAFYQLRRLLRSWAISDAKKEQDPQRRKRRVRACKRLLKGTNSLRGCREWVPEHIQLAMLEWVASQPGGGVLTIEEFEELMGLNNKHTEEEGTCNVQ